ncbi:PLP-dependent aminotransferase family protein [Sinomicrobium weinanense]|uniref:PLP-dependent aminotransferase family protein n=1 Tax=Sinomicrobium weinanense TaxID=2842200 RepID=A0A926JV47_9FLAO|nr:PLP-dependent aminotransferase family protein [Sinomicrobium weinanense]MBC9797929.1 PLP-dependent aminotransferase family protein [Sinomicrobium weinanense]MBU3123182.1 PLP-dependent aminotransferase family protein [Sinomicrobium weinanense]
MDFLQEITTIDHKADTPVYLQITNAFIHNIRSGHFRKGVKLPGSRKVAALLKVNRMTVVAAYEELQAQGWIEKRPQSGTFVKNELPLLSPERIAEKEEPYTVPESTHFNFDENRIFPIVSSGFPPEGKLVFNDGFPDPRLAPVEALLRNMRSLSRRAVHKKYFMYGGSQGTLILRKTLSEHLSDTRGLPVTPENILITKGSQMGIFLATSLLIQPGEDIIIGEPGFTGAEFAFRQLEARINRVPVDEDGIDVEAIERLCRTKTIRFVYVIPHHHNPTTVTLTPERRIKLLELALAYKFAILEDDYDYDFHYASKPMMPMASLDRYGSVIYIGTLTKTLAPAIRIGFMVAPENFIRSATHLRKSIDVQGDSLMENAIAELYREGAIARHIKRSVRLYRERRDHLCRLLREELGNSVSFKIPDGGMSVWTTFQGEDLTTISKNAREKGLILPDGKEHDTSSKKYNATRLGFASLNFEEQEQAVGILKALIKV